jgi:hypothetical protein
VSKILGLCRDFDQHLCRVYTPLTCSHPNTLISNGLAGLIAFTNSGIANALKTLRKHVGKDALQ